MRRGLSLSVTTKMLNQKEIEEIIKIGIKVGWIKGQGKTRYVAGGTLKNFKISTPWGSDSFSIDTGGFHLVFSSDQHTEGTHFETSYMHLDEVGERALRCAVSDIAVTGAEPIMAFVNVGAKTTKIAEKIGDGLIRCANELGIKLCGGDIGRSDRIQISSFVVGFSKEKPLSRYGARPGDHIFVTGTIGDAALAFHTINKKGRKFAEKNIPKALEKFLRPPVRKPPREIRDRVKFSSDISDGIVVVCQWISILNSVSLEFFPERIPFSEEFIRFSHIVCNEPHNVALSWGEDYELVFGIGESELKSDLDIKRFRKFGEIVGIFLSTKDCENALEKKYSYISLKGIDGKRKFMFFSPLANLRPSESFRHFRR